MKFLRDVPYIFVIVNDNIRFNISTTQYYYEDDDRVIIRCAEHTPDFKRGFVCDINCDYIVADQDGNKLDEYRTTIKDLVLVYVNKKSSIEILPEFEYIFYK